MNIWCKIAAKLDEENIYFEWNENSEHIVNAGELTEEIFKKDVIKNLTEEDIEDLTAFRIKNRVDFYIGLLNFVIENYPELLETTIQNILDSLTWFFSYRDDDRINFIKKILGSDLDLENLDSTKETIAKIFWKNIKDLDEEERIVILGNGKIYDKFGDKFENDYWVKKLEKEEWIDYADPEILDMLFKTPEEKLLPFAHEIAVGAKIRFDNYFDRDRYAERFINKLMEKEYFELFEEICKYEPYFKKFNF